MNSRVAASERLVERFDAIVLDGVSDPEGLAELGRLGAQLVIQRAIEDEVAAFLGRARYGREPDARGWRNGVRPRRIQTAEGPLTVEVPQVRGTLVRFVSSVIPDTRAIIRTRPLEALVIGTYVRGLADLAREAGLGQLSKSSVSRLCRELRDRYRAFRARSLADVRLLALFLDAIYLPVRPDGPREGVLVAWGFDLDGALWPKPGVPSVGRIVSRSSFRALSLLFRASDVAGFTLSGECGSALGAAT